MSEPSVIPNSEKPINPVPNQAKTLTIVIYALQAASFIVGLTFLVAVIINYIKRDDVRVTFPLADPYILVLFAMGSDRCFIECCRYWCFYSAGKCRLGNLPYRQRLDKCSRQQTDVL